MVVKYSKMESVERLEPFLGLILDAEKPTSNPPSYQLKQFFVY